MSKLPIASRFIPYRLETLKSLSSTELLAAYNALRTYESDFDKAQGSLRTIASAWLLAAVGGLGLIFQMRHAQINPLSPEAAAVLRQALLLFASTGLISLWFLDQRVYQQLLHASFALGCWMEVQFKVLPPARIYLYLLNRDITKHLGWFYRGPLWVLGIAALVNVVHAFLFLEQVPPGGSAGAPEAEGKWVAVGWLAAMHFVAFVLVLAVSARWPRLAAETPPELVAARGKLERGEDLSTDPLTTPPSAAAAAAASGTRAAAEAATDPTQPLTPTLPSGSRSAP